MIYRSDIDGLRALAVIAVIAFHSGISAFSGGYVGVDVFFVISGYLITTLLYKDVSNETFSFVNFYTRRAARLLPALLLTLFFVFSFGFIFYNINAFDNLGKEIFFSSLGAANILFAQGINYFTRDEAFQPLIHLWSLGVEEQFYLIWPVVFLITLKTSKKLLIPVTAIIFSMSFYFSVNAVQDNSAKAYFLIHYRAFELLIGAITAIYVQEKGTKELSDTIKTAFSLSGASLIIASTLILDKNSSFPGHNALWPCLGTALIILSNNKGPVSKLLSSKIFVWIGLISYPLYLFHQPLISFIKFFDWKLSPSELFFTVTPISVAASWLTYKFVERPIRGFVKYHPGKKSFFSVSALGTVALMFAAGGIVIAKSGGLQDRFKLINPFALEITQAHRATFHDHFDRGFKIKPGEHGHALFVGDSLLQQYILPMSTALGLDTEEVDTVTRGGCVLLKGVDFIDQYSDISCEGIRDKLYNSKKRYKFVIISQSWDTYDSSVLNFPKDLRGYKKWEALLTDTVEHFLKISDRVIIIGGHPYVDGTNSLQPSIRISKAEFLERLKNIKIVNAEFQERSKDFFSSFEIEPRVVTVDPFEIFCKDSCIETDENWSFFTDHQHISNASTHFVSQRLSEILKRNSPEITILTD